MVDPHTRPAADLSTHQPDLAQRYQLLGEILQALAPPAGTRLRVLDLGSGGDSLVADVAPDGIDLHLADVDASGNPAVTLLEPGRPLPFAPGAFDVVLALEVLEHVPSVQRPLFLAECLRVASRAVVLSTPVGIELTRRMEASFRQAAERLTSGPLRFLDEHQACGLADPELVKRGLALDGADVVTIDNGPLFEWLLANLVDLTYAAKLAGGPEKAAANQRLNRRLPTQRVGDPHYRRYYCALRDPRDVRALRALAARREAEAPPLSFESFSDLAVDALVNVVTDLSKASVASLAHKDVRVEQLEKHVAGLTEELGNFKHALDAQQQHAEKMQAALEAESALAAEADRRRIEDAERAAQALQAAKEHEARVTAALAAATDARGAAEARLSATRATVEAQEVELAVRLARVAHLEQSVAEVGAAAERLQRERSMLEQRLARLHAEQTRLASALHAVTHSRLWRGLTPVRRVAQGWKAGRLYVDVQWRRYRMRGRPGAAWPRDLSRRLIEASRLFDVGWYCTQYPDVPAAGLDPLDHFLSSGAAEGRRPHPLFDTTYYVGRYEDVGTSGMNPLVHYVLYGSKEGRWTNPAFDSAFYRRTYPDVAASRLTPLTHYVLFGAAEGRRPSAYFDPAYYVDANPDVRSSGVSALEHYVTAGAFEGRLPSAMEARPPVTDGSTPREDGPVEYLPPVGLLPWFNPLNVVNDHRLDATPKVNVLLPGLGMRHMSGGPNTVLAFAARLAAQGVPLRLVSTDVPTDDDPAAFWAHVTALAGGVLPDGMELVDAHDRSVPWRVGARDLFMASAWWTAQQAKYAMRQTRGSQFLYFIQDYEPLLHAASTAQALAEETYSLEYVPIVNTHVLADFFAERRIGRFARPEFRDAAIVFEPALDRTLFHPARRQRRERRRLLFYARPTNGLRNLFELGVAALQQAVAEGVFDPTTWEFIGMGESFPAVDLGHGAVLRPAPWLGLQGYADQMRESDVLLSLMLSPHPSYPPLEMAACGGVAVTTAYANKDAARLQAMSPRILGVPATIEGLVAGLTRAVTIQDSDDAEVRLPGSWDTAFAEVVPAVASKVRALMGLPLVSAEGVAAAATFPGYRWPREPYEIQRLDALVRRAADYRSPAERLLFSVITPVWNTPPAFLEELCLSVLNQDCPRELFEWVVVDNGSTRPETRTILERWAAADSRLRLHRNDENLGILGGLRMCLQQARGRYVVTLDHDDLLTPDALRVLGHVLCAHGYPPLAYSDEDKIEGDVLRDPYHKPDWDPVLFAHSCYISHVGVLDREAALRLGAYTDPATEGSHDWDSFVRFATAGAIPLHVPEVLYTWRMHAESTAGNIDAKPYVVESQRRVLEKFARATAPTREWTVVPSELFQGSPDWRLLTDEVPNVRTVLIGPSDTEVSRHSTSGEMPRVASVVDELVAAAREALAEGRLLHLLARGVTIDENSWSREAGSLMALFPDAVMVGGPLFDGVRIVDGARVAGLGRGLDAVDAGRFAQDPGYFAQAWKAHTVDAVPASHLVIDPEFLLRVAHRLPCGVLERPSALGPWLSVAARLQGRRVIYSPYLRASLESAKLAADWQEAVLGPGQALVAQVGERDLWSPHLSWSMYRGLALRDPSAEPRPYAAPERLVESYATWLAADRDARRITRPDISDHPPTIAVLTSVWARTPAQLFAETVDSVIGQAVPPDEWIILTNGPVPADVREEVERARSATFVRIVDIAENVGIIGAMRVCLAAATAEYVLPLDADDLLELDTIEQVVAWADATDADLLYSDEDHLVGGAFDHPFLRSDFDPVLHAESAYVWHACAFRRERAGALGVYEDANAEYCHDWDTVGRFAAAGARIVHIPHLLYHWRTHAASHSNSGQQHPGTVASTRFVLERAIAETAHPRRYRVTAFPKDRGAQEWFIERLPEAFPPRLCVRVGPPNGSIEFMPEPVDACASVFISGGDEFRTALQQATDTLPEDALVMLMSASVSSVNDAGWADAVKLLELHRDVDAVGGRLLDRNGVVLEAGRVCIDQGAWLEPFVGRPANDPGPFALALKPHCVDRPAARLMIVRKQALKSVLRQATAVVSLDDVADALAAACLSRQRRIAYSPLLEGLDADASPLRVPAVTDTRRFRDRLLAQGHAGRLPVFHGAARVAMYERQRRLR